jgi:hypothetical protein
MASFTYKCPACACELEVEDESRGETSECPNCQAEIKIPLVRAPRVVVPQVTEQPAAPRPVPEKKLVVSQQTAAALATAGQPRKASKAGIVAGVFVGLIIGLILGLCAPVRLSGQLSSEGLSKSLTFLRPSKGEWRGKLLQNYALRNDRICVPAAEATNAIPSEKYTLQAFQLALGKPDKVETNGDDKALFYICNDGQVQVLISATNYDAGQVVGALIKDE